MAIDRRRLLAELPLPLPQDAGELEVIGIAIAVEDVLAVTLPEEKLTVTHLGTSEAIECLLDDRGHDLRGPDVRVPEEPSSNGRDVDGRDADEYEPRS